MASDTERELFASAAVAVGYVDCPVDHPSFAGRAAVAGYRFVFPRHSLWVETARSGRFVSDASIVEYYNAGDEFSRQPIDPRGDRTEWYQVREADVREIVGRYDPAAADGHLPFRFTHGSTDNQAYLIQRTLVRRIVSGSATSSLEIEEAVLDLLDRVLARAYDARPAVQDSCVTREEREIASRASALLSQMTSAHATLASISRASAVSVFHLSRVFRKVTGRTLARHHLHLRLLASLGPLGESDRSIQEIASNHGFAGHSHYSSVFRRVFGVTPSSYRALPTSPRRRAVDSVLGQL